MDDRRIRTINHESDLGRWELVFSQPDPRLRDYVRGYEGYRERSTTFERRLQVPSGDVAVIINFGPGFLVDGPEYANGTASARSSFVAGLHETHALVSAIGPQYCLQVDFTPIGAHRFFGVAMSELRNRSVPLEDVLGSAAALLIERLHNAENWPRRFAIMDEVLAARISQSTREAAGVAWAWRQIVSSCGTGDVGTLAEEVGCSRKHLITQFHQQVGMPPKKLGRILRFNRTLRLSKDDDNPDWGTIARHCGYYDQAHLIREFRQFSGLTPTEYHLRLLPDDSGVIGD